MKKNKAESTSIVKVKVSRQGVHAKCNTSNLKYSKSYKKSYKGQGR